MKISKKVGNFIDGCEIFEGLIFIDDLCWYHFDEYRRVHNFIRSPLVWCFTRDPDWDLVVNGVTDFNG
jgi:hypothetical protein